MSPAGARAPGLPPGPALHAGMALPGSSSWWRSLAGDVVADFFRWFERWVESGTAFVLREAWRAMSATTEPVLAGAVFGAEYRVMVLVAAGTVLPLLLLAVLQAIAQQDPGGLLRTALLRLPLALLLSGVVIELVSLGLTFTDQWSLALLGTGDGAVGRVFAHLEADVLPSGAAGLVGFAQFVLVLVVAVVGFMLWVELAVRSAAVAVAALFLPVALAGLVWPATSRLARRLGETLAGLVLTKLVMAAVLALAGGAIAAGAGGLSSIVEGVALLGLAVFSPFALFRLIPMIEQGAVSHLEGVRPAATVKDRAWAAVTGAAGLAGGALGGQASGSGAAAGPSAPSAPSAPAGAERIPEASSSLYGDGGSAPGGGSPGGPGPGSPGGPGPGTGNGGGGGPVPGGGAGQAGGGRVGFWESHIAGRSGGSRDDGR